MIRYAYLASLLPTLLAILGNCLGSWWTLAATGFFAALAVPDWLWHYKGPLHRDETVPEATLWLQALLQTVLAGTLLGGVASHIVDGWFIPSATLSTGLSFGVGGLTAAHELMHRRSAVCRGTGIWLCFLNHYSHYYTEHLQNHHPLVASDNDPVTARFGESIYHYLARLGVQQFIAAWNIEAARLKKAGRCPYRWDNFVFSSTLAEYACLLLIARADWVSAACLFFAGTTARFFLETATYAQHYGLTRQEAERIGAAHSWENASVPSRILFLELVRHADHHLHGSRPYQALTAHAGSPKLPAGHFGLFFCVLIPPLWFKITHPLLQASRVSAATRHRGNAE